MTPSTPASTLTEREIVLFMNAIYDISRGDFEPTRDEAQAIYRASTPPAIPVSAGVELGEMEARKDAAYLERNQVVAALASAFPSGIRRTAIEGWSEDWHGCVYIDLPTGQASWHYHDSQAHLFAHLPPYAGEWDGHSTEEKYLRLAALSTPAAVEVSEPVGLLRRATDLHEKAFMPFDQAVELAMSERGLSMPLYQAVGKLVCHIGYEGSIEADHDLVDEVMGALHAIDGGTPVQEPSKHDSLGAMACAYFGTPGTQKAVDAVFATPVVQGEPVAVGIVDGNEVSRRILWGDVAAFDYPVGTKLYATPAPSPKEPGEAKPWDQKTALEKAPSLIAELEAESERRTRYTNDTGDGLLQEAANVIAALATRGPIGAVEPVTDEQIIGVIKETPWLTANAPFYVCLAFARAVLALSRTPGAGNAD